MSHPNFVHLHVHSEYSLLDGANRIQNLIDRAQQWGMPAVALTDHGNMFGAIEFYRKARGSGVKPILGCEVYMASESRFDRKVLPGGEYAHHLTLLVQNEVGYRNLSKLVTAGYLEGFYYRPRIDKTILAEHAEGLLALSGCWSSELSHLLLKGEIQQAEKLARWYQAVFGAENYYLEIQDQGLEGQQELNTRLFQLSQQTGIPLVATNDCHYFEAEDAKVHDVLLCIQTGKAINDPKRLKFSSEQFYFKSAEEMYTLFRSCPEVLERTIEIAERCSVEIPLGQSLLPRYEVPPGYTLEGYLEKLAWEGLEERLKFLERKGNGFNRSQQEPLYRQRLAEELKIINAMGYPGYFLIVWDFVRYAKEQGIPVGPGRGSAAGSLLAYVLRITDLDPLKYDLIFERFLNPERVTLPDIDIDFCMERRDEVISYVTEKYGKENVAQIITFGKMLAKGVIRDVGRALDLPYGEVDKVAKLVPAKLNMTLEKAMEEEPRLKELAQQEGTSKTLLTLAQKLEGMTRHASIHAAGVVISPKPLTEFLPLYKGTRGEAITTQFPMEDIEALGLLKIDFLGLRTLTVIHHTLELIRQGRGEELVLEEIPLDDKATYQLLSEAKTFGIFQLESQGLRDILQKLQPEVFEDLIALVALYRPGPLGSGMIDDFIQRKHGKIPITYELPQLEAILKETYGVIVYQEQVMKIASILAGFSLGAADLLRRAMGKKKADVMAQQRAKFVEGAMANGISKEKAEKIFALMEHFAGYGFNKSHSATYALIAYHTAYLKAHYPTEYMAALLTSDMDKTDKIVRYIRECQEMGIQILSPDVNESYRDFRVVGEQIRFGLAAVKNVGEGAIENILQVRKAEKFRSFVDFCQRVDLRQVNRRMIESLIKCGAFDSLGEKRAQMFASLDEVLKMAQQMFKERENGQINLFGGADQDNASLPSIAFTYSRQMEEWEQSQLLNYEKEALGFYLSGHPLSHYKRKLQLYTNTDAERVQTAAGGTKVTLGGIITQVRFQTTKKGDRMAFLTLEDLQGEVEVIVFPDVYQQCALILEKEKPVLVRGTVDTSGEKSAKIIAGQVLSLEESPYSVFSRCHLKLYPSRHERGYLEQLSALLQKTPGKLQVYLHFFFPDNREVVLLPDSRFQVTPSDPLFHEVEALLGEGVVYFE